MAMLLINGTCTIEQEDYSDDSFECSTKGRFGCPKLTNKFQLNVDCFYIGGKK